MHLTILQLSATLYSKRAGPGPALTLPWGQDQLKSGLAQGQTGQGRAGPRAKRARPCPWTM